MMTTKMLTITFDVAWMRGNNTLKTKRKRVTKAKNGKLTNGATNPGTNLSIAAHAKQTKAAANAVCLNNLSTISNGVIVVKIYAKRSPLRVLIFRTNPAYPRPHAYTSVLFYVHKPHRNATLYPVPTARTSTSPYSGSNQN